LISALRIGSIVCMTGVITVLVLPVFVPLIVDQLCNIQPTQGNSLGNLSKNLRGEDCTEVITAGFLTILTVPGTFLLQIGVLVVIMAVTNRIAYKKSEHTIQNDWGNKYD
jgi:hypothetical protein